MAKSTYKLRLHLVRVRNNRQVRVGLYGNIGVFVIKIN